MNARQPPWGPALKAAGIRLFQGYCFAKPAFEALSPVQLDAVPAVVARVT
ncbi:hypothetical protein NNX39_15325 [Arthrobacter sp. zg-Y826]|nr:hypothetical protein [Arthrobacter jinronghuae]MCQ1957865.1 hypothetical protein [Arthrobacter jinronghuae]